MFSSFCLLVNNVLAHLLTRVAYKESYRWPYTLTLMINISQTIRSFSFKDFDCRNRNGKSILKQNRAQQSRMEPSGAKRSCTKSIVAKWRQTKQNRVEQIHTEQKGARAEPNRTSKTKLKTVPNGERRQKELHVLNGAEWSQAEQSWTEPNRTKPNQAEQRRMDPDRAESCQSEEIEPKRAHQSKQNKAENRASAKGARHSWTVPNRAEHSQLETNIVKQSPTETNRDEWRRTETCIIDRWREKV